MTFPTPKARWIVVAALALLWAVGIGMRLTSLTTAPDPNADEAFFGVQAARLLRGQTVSGQTASGNPINPFLLAMELPVVAMGQPSMAALRGTAAFWGLLAVVLMAVLMRRALDAPTATIAATLLLVLPLAIVHSRIAAEPCQVPLWGVVSLYFALRGHRLGVFLSIIAGFFAYHTTIMAAPIAMTVLLVTVARQNGSDPVRRWRSPLVAAMAGAAVVGPILYWKQGTTTAKWTYATYGFGPADWGLFAHRLQNALLGFCNGVPNDTSTALAVLFWGVIAATLGAGSIALYRRREWERLTLVLAVVAATLGYHLTLGPGGFHPALTRYGLFLVAPAALAFACCARASLVEAATPARSALRGLQLTGLLAMGFALVFSFKVNHFDVFAAQWSGVGETARTLRTEAIDPKRHIARLIARDLRGTGATPQSPRNIITGDWWHYRPIQFHYSWRDDVHVTDLERTPPDQIPRILRQQLEAGHYIVGDARLNEQVQTIIPPGSLRTWKVQLGAHPPSYINRVRRPSDTIASRDGETSRR